MSSFEIIDAGSGRFVKAWKRGVSFEDQATEQLKNTAQMPFIFKWVAAMADAHYGLGATVGTVLPTRGAIIPAAVGADIGCGMLAIRMDVHREELGDLHTLRGAIERAVPTGRTCNGGPGDRGAWADIPEEVSSSWYNTYDTEYTDLCIKHPGVRAKNTFNHLGTLGTGNHFIELSEDEQGHTWIVLHSGSRGMGAKIGGYFTDLAKKLCKQWFITLPDPNLSYFPQGTPEFDDYKNAATLAQKFAWENRLIMSRNISRVVAEALGRDFVTLETTHCHHNYLAFEHHFGENVIITRKGAVRARKGDMGIIPGSMGARSYIVRGLGNPDSFMSCSHGAGRSMSRTQALRTLTLEDHIAATEGVECAKDISVLDETPGAYKPIDAVMAAQSDLVEPVYVLKQYLCVKGSS